MDKSGVCKNSEQIRVLSDDDSMLYHFIVKPKVILVTKIQGGI